MSNPPNIELLRSRYGEPRTLRTRATGTPFRVVARNGQLVIIPRSGNERPIDLSELRRAWPLIARGASRTALKAVTNNSSYLDAIYDDLHADATESGPNRIPIERRQPPGQDLALKLREVAGLLAEVTRERDALRAQLAAIDRAREFEETSVEKLEATIARLQGELHAAKRANGQLAATLEETERRLESATNNPRTVDANLSLTIDKHVFDSKRELRPDLWEILYEAGQLAFKFPHGSVAGSRRAIETALGLLWRQATGGEGTPKVAEMLNDLRGHRLMPTSDWHLAKNLYGRASAITHEGTKRPDLALWIFFGAVQICELVQPDAPA